MSQCCVGILYCLVHYDVGMWQVYKVSEEELIESSLLDAVVNRIACKDCM